MSDAQALPYSEMTPQEAAETIAADLLIAAGEVIVAWAATPVTIRDVLDSPELVVLDRAIRLLADTVRAAQAHGDALGSSG